VMNLVRDGVLDLPIQATVRLEQIPEIHALMENRGITGKVLVDVLASVEARA